MSDIIPINCAGKVVGVYTEKDIDLVETEDAKKLVRQKIGFKKRKGCGYNITALVRKLPFDGKNHKVECPKCKNIINATNVPREDIKAE